jgi:hypothetical protein
MHSSQLQFLKWISILLVISNRINQVQSKHLLMGPMNNNCMSKLVLFHFNKL